VTATRPSFAALVGSLPDPLLLFMVGTGKNAGKTTALNAVLEHLDPATVGLVSVGVDGEATDALTGGEKPPVRAGRGALICTTEGACAMGEALLRIEESLPLTTALGPLVVARVLRQGGVLLVGPETNHQVREVVGRLKARGATRVLVDGAFDRRTQLFGPGSSPAPSVVLVASPTGEDLDAFVKDTAHHHRLLTLPEAPADLLPPDDGDFPLRARVGTGPWRVTDSLETLSDDPDLNREGLVVRLNLPLTRDGAAALNRTARGILVVNSGAQVFLSAHGLKALADRGWQVFQRQAARCVAVLLNSQGPAGLSVPPGEALARIGQAVAPTPVYDLFYREQRP